MELNTIIDFFADFDKISQEQKNELSHFLLGLAMLSSDPNKIADIIFSEKEYEEAYMELSEAVTKDEKLIDKSGILKRLADNKDLLEKVRKYYALKRELAKVSEPLVFYSSLLNQNGCGSINFFLLMSMLNLKKGISPIDVAIDTSKI